MNYEKSSNLSEDIINKIVSVAYKDAGFSDRLIIKYLSIRNPEIKKLLKEYKATAAAVRSIDPDECPEKVLMRVRDELNTKFENRRTFLLDLYSVVFTKPLASAAAVSIMLIAILSVVLFQKVETTQNFSREEIEIADKQVKESIVILSNIFNRTQETLEKDILSSRVGKPIFEGINLVNNLFKEGEKNETIK